MTRFMRSIMDFFKYDPSDRGLIFSGKSELGDYEVTRELFYLTKLNPEDSELLKQFVKKFGDDLSIPSAILAVGSSTFPEVFWEGRRKLRKDYPDLEVAENYNDIDLLVIPEQVVPFENLDLEIKKVLGNMDLSYESHDVAMAGVLYGDGIIGTQRTKVPFLNLDYGKKSIETCLENGRKIDLIIGRDDLADVTASEKIEYERKNGIAFSLLYRRE